MNSCLGARGGGGPAASSPKGWALAGKVDASLIDPVEHVVLPRKVFGWKNLGSSSPLGLVGLPPVMLGGGWLKKTLHGSAHSVRDALGGLLLSLEPASVSELLAQKLVESLEIVDVLGKINRLLSIP